MGIRKTKSAMFTGVDISKAGDDFWDAMETFCTGIERVLMKDNTTFLGTPIVMGDHIVQFFIKEEK